MYESTLTLSRIGIILNIDPDMNDPLFEPGMDYLHKNFTELFGASQRPMLRKFLDKAASSQKLQCIEFFQGKKSFYQLRCIFYNPQQALCIITNDTKHREGLKELEDYNMQAIIDSYEDWIWSFDTYYTLVTANKAYLDARHRINSKTLSIGDNILKDVDEAVYKKWMPIYERALKGETITFEEKRNQGGREYYVEVYISPVYNTQNVLIGCMGVTRDITKRKTAQLEMESHSQKLEEFAMKTSHELRQPIANIMGMAALFDDKDLDEEEKDKGIKSILECVNELDKIAINLVHAVEKNVKP
jgi:PAS domain S-box-containing protein